jgi:hypothetical protein
MRMVWEHRSQAFGGGASALSLPSLRIRPGSSLTGVRHLVSRNAVQPPSAGDLRSQFLDWKNHHPAIVSAHCTASLLEAAPQSRGRTPVDEGMTDGPSTFAYLAFWPRRDTVEGISKPMKMTAWRGPGT